VTLTDIDEVRNRIVVGMSTDARAVEARTAFANAGLGGYVVVTTAPPPIANSTLISPGRPVPGGAEIRLGAWTGGTPCTMGFNLVRYMGTFDDTVATARYFTTTSHCTSSQWSTDGTYAYQNPSFAATETGDPSGFTGAPCMTGYTCRYSDATVFTYYDDSLTADDGRVAYPTDTASTTFTTLVTMQDVPTPYVGETIHMIGAASGRRRGSVSTSCTNVWGISGWGSKELLCQNKASYFSNNGDSGAPVIALYSGTTGGALGQHWGNATTGGVFQYSWFSPMYAVLNDLYALSGSPNYSPVVY
jgi:hypothetical protein